MLERVCKNLKSIQMRLNVKNKFVDKSGTIFKVKRSFRKKKRVIMLLCYNMLCFLKCIKISIYMQTSI